MKKLLLLSALLLPLTSPAALLLTEPFDYPDGAIVGASGSSWAAHSGAGSGPISVVGGELKVICNSSAAAEDINIGIPGAPYDTTNNPTVGFLYASMKLRFEALPSANGTYFAHFKEPGTMNFRGRLFALTNGAAAGNFRLAIASTNGATTTAGVAQSQDLTLNTPYTVVMRLNLANGNSTLWIDPTAETSTSVSTTADPGTSYPMSGFAFRQSTGAGVVFADSLKIGTSFNDVAGNNTPPTISSIANRSTPANTPTAPITFTVGDGETPAGALVVSATSLNPSLVPNSPANLALGGSGANRTLTVTPAAGQQGSATIEVSVKDANNNTTTTSFTLTIGAPSISDIADLTVPQNAPVPPIAFTVSDNESAAGTLTVSATSSNSELVENASILFSGTGANRTMTIYPVIDTAGITTITVSVSDGINTTSTSFVLTINPVYGLIFSDAFDYPDGSLLLATGSTWNQHSPLNTLTNYEDVQVISGVARLNSALAQDLNALLTNAPFFSSNGVILYCGFKMQLNSLPYRAGDYFMHFKDPDTGTTFRCKLFVSTTNAATGFYRIGIANAINSPSAEIAQDLALGTAYNVVFRYNVSSPKATLWLNPASESDPSVTATDTTTASTVAAIALRESSGIGVIDLDNLKVGTSFADVSAPAPKVSFAYADGTFTLSWAAGLTNALQYSTDLSTWQNVGISPTPAGDKLVLPLPKVGAARFFRLQP